MFGSPNPCRRRQAPAGYYYAPSTNRGGLPCSLKKRRNFQGVFGLVPSPADTEPFTPAPTHLPPVTTTALPPIRCRRHQAPAGYYYRLVAGKCMLWKKHPNTPLILPASQAGLGFIYQTPSTVTASVQGVVGNAKNWITNNKGLALALAVGGYYLFNKK